MKITPNYIQTNKIAHNPAVQSFTSNPEVSRPEVSQVSELSNVTQDYAVRTPIAYSHVEDIPLTEGISAKCYKLANGQKVVIIPKDGPTFVKSYVNTGSFNEPDHLRGISHYIEHNLFNGSEDLGDKVFFDEVNKMGANTNASTSFSVTDYYIQSNLLEDTDLENKIQLHAGMLQSPKFLLEKLEKEKNIVNSEINMCVSEDENIGFSKTLKNLFNINSSSLDLIAGTTDNITALTRDDVVNYFKSNYYPANMVTVITGEVEPEETMKLIAKYFTASNNPVHQRHFETMTPIEKPIRQDIISQKTQADLASIFLGFAGPKNNDTKDKIYLQAASYLFGGLANSRIANLEKKYGIGINISPERLSSRPDDLSMMVVQSAVSDAKVEPLLKDLYSAIQNLAQNPPTEEEMIAIKSRMKKNHNAIFESTGAMNYYIGTLMLNNNLEHAKDYDKIIDEMTPQDIVNVAKKYLDLNKVALTVVHPNFTNAESIENGYKKVSSVSFTGANKKIPIDVNSVTQYRMSNNFEIIFNDLPTNNVDYCFSLASKAWTPKTAAVANVLSDMIEYNGTKSKSYDEVHKQSDMLALDHYVGFSQMGISAGANFPVENADKSLALLHEQIKEPNLTQENFEAAVARLKDYYKGIETSPRFKFNKVVYDGTPGMFSPKDKLESLETMTLDDVKKLYEEVFVKGQGQVVVSGPFSAHPELKQSVFNSVAGYSTVQPLNVDLEKVYKPIEKAQVLTDINMKNQANIIQGFKFQHNGNIKDKAAMVLMNEIFGGSPSSRLFMDLRESRNLAYAVRSGCSFNEDMGVFTLSIGTTTENQETGEKTFDNVQKSIEGFNENIQKIMTEKVTPEELETAKKALKTTILDAISSTAGKTYELFDAKNTPYGIDYLNKFYATIDTITQDDIQAVANYIFRHKPVYSLTATPATLEANKEYLASLGEVA